MNNHLQCNGLI